MIKKTFVFPVLILVFLFLQTGCNHVSSKAKPSDNQAIRQTAVKQPSANYYYLEARHFIKKNDLPNAALSLEKGLVLNPGSFILTQDLAFIYLRLNQKERALSLVERLAQNYPDNVNGLLLYIQLKKDDISNEKLADLLNRILTLDPTNKETFLRLGKLYMDQEDHVKSKDLFTRMTQQFPDYYVAWYYLGEIYFLEKNFKLAKEPFLKTIELEPELIEPRYRLVSIYEALNLSDKYIKIENTLNQVLELEPGNHRALLGIALNKYKSGNKKDAEKRFMTLGQDFEKESDLMRAAFDEYISGNAKKDAVIIFSQMRKADPQSGTLTFFSALAHERDEQYKKAIDLYLKIKPGHTHYNKAVLNTSVLYRETNQKEKAISYLGKKLKEAPDHVDMAVYLASFYSEDNQEDKALSTLKDALKHSPANTRLLFRLGITQHTAGLIDESVKTMEKIIELDPEDSSALNFVGYTLADMDQRLDYALGLIKRAHRIQPENGHITDSLGWVHYKLGNLDEAIKYMTLAAKQTEHEGIVAEHLGDIHSKRQEYQKAIEAYEKALARPDKDWDTKRINLIKEKITTLKKKLNEK